ncbi:MAG: adenylate/guanylate cyclase domain-containing protein [Bacteroidia bacterium]|nr:adenylate/guanylate cyclase domain-containing protein [Bacteroidia bacterium]
MKTNHNPLSKLFTAVTLIGTRKGDSEDLRLQKSLLVISSFPFMIAGIAWGIMYIKFGEKLAGFIPLSYSVFSFFSIIYFALTGQFRVFRFSQLLLILLLPFFLMLSLGGFISGSAVILWSLLCPLGAMLFESQRSALGWFSAFILLLIVSGLAEPLLNAESNLTRSQINLFFVINLAGVGSLIFMMVYHFTGRKNFFRQQSELLLLNILPKEIIETLKEQHRTIARHYDSASILFADAANFTAMSAGMTPSALVEMLNEVFSEFDARAEKYGLEKIKTIGDSYMIAAGVPALRSDHALVLTEMAIEMRDYISSRQFMGKKLEFRFGINSGPVVAGVIGKKKFSYDLWGDTVNIASRMESQGRSNAIQISQATYELIKEQFNCEQHGTVNVKGKGEMSTWFVTGKKNPAALGRL